MKNVLWILAFMILLGLLGTGYSCKKKPVQPAPGDETLRVYSNVIQRRLPTSPRVASYLGVSDQQLEWVDDALADLQADIQAEGRSYMPFDPAAAIVYFKHDCELSPYTQTLSFKVRADDYDGTQYDVDPRPGIGKIYAAEYVITDPGPDGQPVPADEWVVCNAASDQQYSFDVARFGKEHIELYRNDRPRYNATVFHGNGVNHPLIPHRSATLRTFVAPIDVAAYYGPAVGRLK